MDKSPKHPHQDTRSVVEQAADWVVELTEAGPAERAAFADWLAASPRHVEEYLLAANMYRVLDGVDSSRQIDIGEVLAEARSNIVSLQEEETLSPAPKKTNRMKWGLAAAASVLITILAGAFWLDSSRSFATRTGELRSLELPDGSVLDLNSQSRVEVRFSKEARTIHLLSGEALFRVAPDPARPFRVQAGATTIQALGTQFNVYRRREKTTVSVLEGAVRISGGGEITPRLTAGEGALIASSGHITQVASVDTAKATAWRQRRLVFVDDTLAEIATQFNRYNATPHLKVEGARAAGQELTGVFNANDPESLLTFIAGLDGLSVERKDGEVIVRAR